MPGTSTWISETEGERARLEAARKAAPAHPAKPLTRDQIAKAVSELSNLLGVLRHASPEDKAEIYTRARLRLTYQPHHQTVHAKARLSPEPHWQFEGVRGGTRPLRTCRWSLVS